MSSDLQSPERDEDDIHEIMDNLHIDEQATTVNIANAESNPWRDAADVSAPADEPDVGATKHIPDPSSLDLSTTQGLAAEQGEEIVRMNEEVLLEFDPLASSEEVAAREAWASSTPHPPSNDSDLAEGNAENADKAAKSADVSSTPSPQTPSTPNRPSSPLPAFPALAALARTFSLPLGSRSQRPRSIDVATSVPSPSTLSSFAQQQSAPPTRTTMLDEASGTTSGTSSGQSTPAIVESERDRGRTPDKDAPSFDFQRFLDQMKTRNAEPVAKYLRSYVSITLCVTSDLWCSCDRVHGVALGAFLMSGF